MTTPKDFQPIYFTLVAPIGTGKTTVMNHLLAADKTLQPVVSYATRPKRPNEVDGTHYHFISKAYFEDELANGNILEHSNHWDHYYGTPRKEFEKLAAASCDGLNDIQYDGVVQLRQSMGKHFVPILMMPPSEAQMKDRLYKRAGKSTEERTKMEKRLEAFTEDWGHFDDPSHVFRNDDLRGSRLTDYAHKVVNDNLDDTLQILHSILEEERRKIRG